MIKNNEQLLSVKSIVNNIILDFTILKVTTDKGVYNVTLNYKPVKTDGYGVVYRYTNTLNDFLKAHNIKTDLYDYSDNKDILKRDVHHPLQCFSFNIFNII